MKIRITQSSNPNSDWYADFTGEEFSVNKELADEYVVMYNGNNVLVPKCDAEKTEGNALAYNKAQYKKLQNKRIGVTEDDINACEDYGTLLSWKIQIDKDCADMKQQIEIAKANAASGEYSERTWFANVNGARKCQGLLSQLIQNRMTVLKKINGDMAKEKNDAFLHRFILNAKLLLPEEKYNEIFNTSK